MSQFFPNRVLRLLLAGCLLAPPPGLSNALAHEGHDHAADPAPVAAAGQTAEAPRFSAQSEDFEVVGVLSPGLPGRLTLYLDDAKTNAPIDGATLEVAAEGLAGSALRESPGTYVLPLKAALSPGKYALTLSIDAPSGGDLLAATLVVAEPPPTAADRVFGGMLPANWLAGGAVLLAGLAGFVYLRRWRKGAGESAAETRNL